MRPAKYKEGDYVSLGLHRYLVVKVISRRTFNSMINVYNEPEWFYILSGSFVEVPERSISGLWESEEKKTTSKVGRIVFREVRIMGNSTGLCNRLFTVLIFDESGKLTNPYDKSLSFDSGKQSFSADCLFGVESKFVYQIKGMPQYVFENMGRTLDFFRTKYNVDIYMEFLTPYKCEVI